MILHTSREDYFTERISDFGSPIALRFVQKALNKLYINATRAHRCSTSAAVNHNNIRNHLLRVHHLDARNNSMSVVKNDLQ